MLERRNFLSNGILSTLSFLGIKTGNQKPLEKQETVIKGIGFVVRTNFRFKAKLAGLPFTSEEIVDCEVTVETEENNKIHTLKIICPEARQYCSVKIKDKP